MVLGTDYAKLYNQAYVAYGQANYEEAATLIEPMAEAFPEDPNVLLLRGHIYFSLGQYQGACQQYQAVSELTDRKDLLDCARQGLEQAQQLLAQSQSPTVSQSPSQFMTPQKDTAYQVEDDGKFDQWQEDSEEENWDKDFGMDGLDWDSAVFNEDDFEQPTLGQPLSDDNPFDNNGQTSFSMTPMGDPALLGSQTFQEADLDDAQSWLDLDNDLGDFSFEDDDLKTETSSVAPGGENTFVVSSSLAPSVRSPDEDVYTSTPSTNPNRQKSGGSWSNDPSQDESIIQVNPNLSSQLEGEDSFLDNLEAFNDHDLDNLSNLDFTEMGNELPDADLFTQGSEHLMGNLGLSTSDLMAGTGTIGNVSWMKPDDSLISDLPDTSSALVKPTVEISQGRLAVFLNASVKSKAWIVAGTTGMASFLAVLLISGFTSILSPKPKPTPSASNTSEQVANPEKPGSKASSAENYQKPSTDKAASSQQSQPNSQKPVKSGIPVLLLALFAGLASFSTTLLFGLLMAQQIKRTVENLQNQFDAMYAGDFNVKATVYSQDELGQLSASFNQVSRVILTTTRDAQQRAAEMEKAREELQRQVIRLLDDVEGAARGDLTVEAEVTADVLGAVADAFNLTIQNLREIVGQVKRTAKQVNKGSTDSELFARNNSSDSLRMAEELAVTLNSVQVMTESIQRVAENAREAEEVAHTSSVTALKGGEAVERTVAGILQIRETVSETARKVKRLAEASQEISKIVALISQIASRTNLLALNASIQAARAGEAGRGFAIVADEVRQLADRSAKSLKEIEQIVLQIQSETGSVMTAMEEGIQQVIDVADKSEQAKRSLEDIIEVSNRINGLVRSIGTDTVQQRENSRAVAQVMQSVELTAQETSQESQRVAGSLQNLVGISRDLLTSVEKFRVDKEEK
ncbi:methyl-accepting chemotaxis protein [Aphanothece sacrum]|uniref:Methyl-accepting chemotaxis protein n=1 Tax=Aphanothece sacrum FPU1 TaxID=1920663 RepID=A0A401IKH8_APHSA|nr:methyl-accepting chemotaxis protein [Aphanothece sacrum]GBF81793.1 methyl-accepting chemotaxis protein [Aphanothece sacrum FPU1]GBF84325.1 methyl-accepting chemotaxis protein [Aphanothece sacrum FPU3]